MSDPITVDVVCDECHGRAVGEWQLCLGCGVLGIEGEQLNRGVQSRSLAPGSLAALLIEAGMAALAWEEVHPVYDDLDAAHVRRLVALAAVRAHPDYQREAEG